MRIFKPNYVKRIPKHAKRFVRKGVEMVRWDIRGNKSIEATVHPTDPSKCRYESDIYHIEFNDANGRRRSKKAYADRASSESEMMKLRTKLARLESGVTSAEVEKRKNKAPSKILEEWIEYLKEGDRSAMYVENCRQRVSAIIDRTGAVDLTDLTDSEVSAALREMRTNGGPSGKKLSAQTSNHYLTVVKSFLRWCIDSGYLEASPIRSLKRIECDSRRTFERRALTVDELSRLIESTVKNKLHRGVMTGEDRACLYLVAAFTGFRVKELASLTPESFMLSSTPPVILLHGRSTKNKKQAAQPFQADLVPRLTLWLADKPPGKPVWPGYAWSRGKANRMLRTDMEHAKIEATDAHGRRIDFHAFRGTLATMLAQSGVSLQHAQKLMRHSDPRLTAKYYTFLDVAELAAKAEKLPVPELMKVKPAPDVEPDAE